MRSRPVDVPNLQYPMHPPLIHPLTHCNIEPGIDKRRGAPSSPSMRRVTAYLGTDNTRLGSARNVERNRYRFRFR